MTRRGVVVASAVVRCRTQIRCGVAIATNVVRREDVTLEVGQVSESVTVAASHAVLQTDKANVHTELGSKELSTCHCRYTPHRR